MNSEKWSSFDPLTIPLEIRKKQLEKGNIVPNNFFEQGTASLSEGPVTDFTLEKWTVVGNNVEWVDINHELYSSDDVSTGNHAVKISREKANETDKKGDGVESGFLPVIPGNYDFTYDVKLKDIYPVRPRFGTKLYDAIDVRLLFFDADKNPIEGTVHNPLYGFDIDNSFKGFTFSNFWHIGDFGWDNVVARTFNYPFSEGDIPDNCRFVKLFFGLRGNGTMWVDNVEFKFSRWNFTAIEKLLPYIDADYSVTDLLIPTPKQVGSINPIKFSSAPEAKPLILTPQKPGKAAAYAIETLREQIEISAGEGVEIITTLSQKQLDSGRLVFSIGKTALLDEYKTRLPYAEIEGEEQGYFIKRLSSCPNVIFLAGNTETGDFYAVTSAVQLFDKHKNIYYYADIIDYPDFLGRSFMLRTVREKEDIEHNLVDIKRMSAYKLNKLYSSYVDPTKDWLNPPQMYLDGLHDVGKRCKETGVVDLAAQVNPYFQFEYEAYVPDISEELKNYWLHCRPEDMEKLKDRIRYYFDCGATCLMLLADDFVPHEEDYRKIYSLWTQEDKDKFVNLQNAHAYMINEVYTMLKDEYPGSRMEFCPPAYLNEFIDRSRGSAEQYFRDLMAQIPEDIAIIWTGNTVRSLSFDMADIERYRELIGRYPMLFDNTLYARRSESHYGGYPGLYPGKVRMCSVFEPYDLHLPKDFHKYNDGRHLYMNGGSQNEQGKIQYLTVADYEWNSGSYNPDLSIWKSIFTQYGKKTGVNLLKFNDNYYGFIDMRMRIEREGKLDTFVTKAAEYTKQAEELLAELRTQIPEKNKDLIEELSILLKQMELK